MSAAVATSPRERVLLALALCTPTPLLVGARMGMETGALVLCAALLWRSLAFDAGRTRDWALRAGIATVMLLLRFDSALVLAALALAHCSVTRMDRAQWARAAWAGASVVAVVGAWMLFCKQHYGTYVPHSMLAKTAHGYANVSGRSLDGTAGDVVTAASALLGFDFPWPTVIRSLARIAWPLAGCAAFALALASLRTSPRPLRSWILASACLIALEIAFFTLGRASVFPWYAHLPVFMVFGSVFAVLIPRRREAAPLVLLLTVLGGFLVQDALVWRGALQRSSMPPGEAVGHALRKRGCDSVMLEPIGYIGYHSNCHRVYDLAGLVSPEIFAYRRSGERAWFYDAVRHFEPQYVVLRSGEVEKNDGWNVGRLFSNDAERDDFRARYALVPDATDPDREYAVYEARRATR